MPEPLLHFGATVLCMHAGQAQPMVPNPRVKVGGKPIVTVAATMPSPVVGSPPATMPCATAQWVTSALRRAGRGRACAPEGQPGDLRTHRYGADIVSTQKRVKGI